MNKQYAGGAHVSMWPPYFPKKKRERGLAALVPVYDQDTLLWGVHVTQKNGVETDIFSWQELVSYSLLYNLDCYVYKLLGKNGFPFFAQALGDERCEAHIANSSKTVTMLSVRGERGRQVKFITSCVWGWRKQPTVDFLKALGHIFDEFDYGVYPSPGSLGQNSLKMMLAPALLGYERDEDGIERAVYEKPHRYSRPSAMLRQRLIDYASGGRADDFANHQQEYETVYETDFDNHHANQALQGVPVDGYETFGLVGVWKNNLQRLGEYALAYVECRVTIPEGNVRKISPFYTRHSDGQLWWETDPGVYYGWYFSPMISEMVKAGYEVEIGYGWGWRELSKFLVPLIERAIALRTSFKKRGMELESDLTKSLIVATLGSFGTQPYRLKLVSKQERQDGDERFLDLDAKPCEGLLTPYYLRRIEEPDAPHLTQVLYAIVMFANVELYKLMLAEEANGNEVLWSNYDAIITEGPPTIALVRKKLKVLHKFRSLGKRSYNDSKGGKHPGVKQAALDILVAVSLPDI